MAPRVRCALIVGLLLGAAVSAPVEESSSISETQVPLVQTRVLPSLPILVPTQEITKIHSTFSDEDIKEKLDSEPIISSSTPHPSLPVLSSIKDVQKRQDENKTISSTAIPKPTIKKEKVPGYVRSDGTYVVDDAQDTPCILAYFKAKVTVSYPTDQENKKYERVIVRPPAKKVSISGSCNRKNNVAIMDVAWRDGTMTLNFAFDSLLDSWYVNEFSFKFDTSKSTYRKAKKGEKVVVRSIKGKRFWTTSHAKSFRCLLLHDVDMKDKSEVYSGIIHFDEVRVQALTKTDNFKTPKHCIHRVHRNEMVPVVVGGSLAGATLLTVIGYAIFRYIKVKKFQYNTME